MPNRQGRYRSHLKFDSVSHWKKRMNRNISVYIDFLRTIAALGVFLGHVRSWIMPGMPILIGAQAGECVAIFFVLSGFVIAFVTESKETQWTDYTRARALRMYSVTLLALVVTLICDRIGYAASPTVYGSLDSFKSVNSPIDYASYLTFSNQVWWANRWIGSNQAFWSMGYEVPYYLVFGLAVFLKGWQRYVVVAIACIAIGPRVIAYMPLWLMGVATFRYLGKHRYDDRTHRVAGGLMLIASVILYAAVRFVFLRKVEAIFYEGSMSAMLRTWLHFNLIGVAIVLNIIGFQVLVGHDNIWPSAVFRVIRWVAGGSFTLYLVHLPIVILTIALFPVVHRSTAAGLVAIFGILAIAYLLAELGERRKKLFQRLFLPRSVALQANAG